MMKKLYYTCAGEHTGLEYIALYMIYNNLRWSPPILSPMQDFSEHTIWI